MEKPEKIRVAAVRVVGEQDGVPEREIKAEFCEFLAGTSFLGRAYLAQVLCDGQIEPNVALLVRLESGDQEAVLSGLAHIFHKVFRQDQHLDIGFISEAKEQEVRHLVKPFFSSHDCSRRGLRRLLARFFHRMCR